MPITPAGSRHLSAAERGGAVLALISAATMEGFRRMTRTRNAVLGLACLGLGGVAGPALAQQLPSQIETPVEAEVPNANPGLQVSVGLGAAYLPDYEGSNDYKPAPLWSLRLGNLYDPETFVSLVATTLRSNLVPSEHWRLGVTARYINDYDNVEDDRVKNISSTEKAVMVGGTVGYDFLAGLRQDAVLEFDGLADAAHGNGYTLTPRFRFRTPVSDGLLFEATASGTWASGDYMENFFGVTSSDAARSGLHPYDANSGFKDVAFSASLTYALGAHWSLTGLGSYERLLGDAADSPIVDDRGSENQWIGAALLSYRF
jgi:outer membrane protein